MDKKTVIALALIALVMFGWMFYSSSIHEQVPPEQKQNIENINETSKNTQDAKNTQEIQDSVPDVKTDSAFLKNKFGTYFEPFAVGSEELIRIETDNYKAVFSNKGGALVRWELKRYNKWDKTPVQLIGYKNYELFVKFTTVEAKKIDSRNLFFEIEGVENNTIKLSGQEKKEIVFKLDLKDGKQLIKKITLQGDKYHIDQDITVNNLDGILKGGYSLIWENSLNYQEANSVDESTSAHGIISMNNSVEEFEGDSYEQKTQDYTGIIDYIAIKTKYFTTAIIPQPWQQFDGTAHFSGKMIDVKSNGKVEKYQMGISVPYKGGNQTNSFKVFIGPIEYKLVKSYGLEATVDLGWRFLIRPIAEYLMLPLFNAVHGFVPNYGIAIILFSILIKLLLYPLSIKQVRNASYMKLLTPEMEKIREKYKDDMQKQQMETMRLYSDYGLNPTGGCLPLLFQMPIFMALWRTLNGAIELRQQPFIFWINDLSRPDVLFGWGFSFLGLSHISGLALLMAITMFIQQKMTVTDPRQKAMVYMMPLMFLFMFANLPAGLNLYYFIFNLLSIGQQVFINNFSSKTVTLEQLKKNPKKKKESWFAKQMKQMEEMQKSTGKPVPPSVQKYLDSKQTSDRKDNNTKYNSNNRSNLNKNRQRKK